MSVRLIVSTLVPPTSPGFGIIIQAATPEEEKWTAMPCFLFASAIAGAWPWLLDKLISIVARKDFCFTMGAKYFADNYPLTCWTGPAMREAFQRVYGDGGDESQRYKNGKLGASFAVIVGHVVPFMGAQTTIMQRYFLPHPLDTIISQPFGMTEDLVSMAMAEAISNPVLASWSLTILIVFFNLARGLVFSGHGMCRRNGDTEASGMEELSPHAADEERDYVALASALINVLVGAAVGHVVAGKLSMKVAFCLVALQMMAQLVVVPILSRCVLGPIIQRCVGKTVRVPVNDEEKAHDEKLLDIPSNISTAPTLTSADTLGQHGTRSPEQNPPDKLETHKKKEDLQHGTPDKHLPEVLQVSGTPSLETKPFDALETRKEGKEEDQQEQGEEHSALQQGSLDRNFPDVRIHKVSRTTSHASNPSYQQERNWDDSGRMTVGTVSGPRVSLPGVQGRQPANKDFPNVPPDSGTRLQSCSPVASESHAAEQVGGRRVTPVIPPSAFFEALGAQSNCRTAPGSQEHQGRVGSRTLVSPTIEDTAISNSRPSRTPETRRLGAGINCPPGFPLSIPNPVSGFCTPTRPLAPPRNSL